MMMKHILKRMTCAFLAFVLIACMVPVKMNASAASDYAGSRLTGLNKQVYDYLKNQIMSITAGESTSTSYSLNDYIGSMRWTKAQLGVSSIIFGGAISSEANNAISNKMNQILDFSQIIDCLIADCPYELFWYDKVTGYETAWAYAANNGEMWITNLVINLTVSYDYLGNEYNLYNTDVAKINAASAVIDKAKAIVAKHASKSDYDKLTAYKDEICALVEYNHAAVENLGVPYGDPWQLIYVFDNDPTTNVVCEGYSKAFKLLCDLSTFETDVACYTVSGYMQGGTGEGNHMWNVVKIGGGTLLVDVTNCDAGTIGAPDLLFMKTGTKIGEYYEITAGSTPIRYWYDQAMYGLYSDGYLELQEPSGRPPQTEKYPDGDTLYKIDGKWHHIIDGQIVRDTTLVKYNGTWFYVKDGVLNTANTLVKYNNKWFHVNGGKLATDTTLVKYNGTWFYVKDGVLNTANTLVKYNNKWLHVNGGKLQKDTTLVKYNGTWFYVKDGVMNTSNTLVKYNNKWYHVNGGKLATDTTLVKYNGTWFYVKDGVMNTSNTLVKYNNKWYHVNGGKLVTDTTLVKYNGTWFYVKDGVMNTSNTLVKYNNKWYHVNGGKLVTDTTLVKYNGTWFYVKDGVLNTSTTLVKYNGKWLFVRNGKLDTSYSGKVLYNGKYYTVKNGVKV